MSNLIPSEYCMLSPPISGSNLLVLFVFKPTSSCDKKDVKTNCNLFSNMTQGVFGASNTLPILNFCVGKVNMSVLDDETYEISSITDRETSLESTVKYKYIIVKNKKTRNLR